MSENEEIIPDKIQGQTREQKDFQKMRDAVESAINTWGVLSAFPKNVDRLEIINNRLFVNLYENDEIKLYEFSTLYICSHCGQLKYWAVWREDKKICSRCDDILEQKD